MPKPFKQQPKYPVGHVPGADFVDGPSNFQGTKIGLITRVDHINMKADVKLVTGVGDRLEVDLTQGMCGPRSFWGGVPEVNSLVHIGYRRIHKNLQEAVILGYIPTGNRSGTRFDPYSPANPSTIDSEETDLFEELFGPTIRYKRMMCKPGEVGGMSSEGSEFLLSRDVSMTNRAGDLIELRDSERSLVMQSVHRVDTTSGVRRITGPIRRSDFYLPDDIFEDDGVTLRSSNDTNPLGARVSLQTNPFILGTTNTAQIALEDSYFGKDVLQASGPGRVAGPNKFANTDGVVLDLFNDFREFPAVVYANGRRVHYAPTSPSANIEDPESPADALVEHRTEISHATDLVQEVLEEIDGFSIDRHPPYIEMVMGTIVGNSLNTSKGQRGYGRVLKPLLFSDFNTTRSGKFQLALADRKPTSDLESVTSAGAFLFRIRPPRSNGDAEFVTAVSKQGKLFLNVPGSTVDDSASGTKNISAEINMDGALKMFLGASKPERISLDLTLEGGLRAQIGGDEKGNCLNVTYLGAVTQEFRTTKPNDDDQAYERIVQGRERTVVSGTSQQSYGAVTYLVDGGNQVLCDRMAIEAHSGYTLNAGEKNELISGKSQLNYALQVLENIITGGRISTIIAGAEISNILAGAKTTTVAAGAHTTNVPGGAYTVTVGTGAISLTTGAGAVALSTGAGAMSLTSGGGAMALTAGLAMNLAASVAISMVSPQILMGGPAAVLGICRGVPALPPGVPTLDPITGIPLQGSAQNRSL